MNSSLSPTQNRLLLVPETREAPPDARPSAPVAVRRRYRLARLETTRACEAMRGLPARR